MPITTPGDSQENTEEVEDEDDEDPNEKAGDELQRMRTVPLEELAEAIGQMDLVLVEEDAGCVFVFA
jgi:hypothetical protein